MQQCSARVRGLPFAAPAYRGYCAVPPVELDELLGDALRAECQGAFNVVFALHRQVGQYIQQGELVGSGELALALMA